MGRTIPGTPHLLHSNQNQGTECLDPSHQSEEGTQISMEGHASPTGKITFFMVIIIIQGWESTSSQDNTEQLWSQAYIKYTRSMGKSSDLRGLNLSTVVIHGSQVYLKREWSKTTETLYQLQGTVGEEIKVGCRMINGTTHKKASQISNQNICSIDDTTEVCPKTKEVCIMNTVCPPDNITACTRRELECWHNFWAKDADLG